MINLMCLIMLITPTYTPETLPTDSGVYNVRISYNNQLTTRSKITVAEETTIQSTTNQEVFLDAQDFYITDLSDIDSETLIERSNVKIWNAETGEYYDIVDVTYSRASDSLYLVSFYQSTDVYITVRMYLISDEEYQETVLPNEYGEFFWEHPKTEQNDSMFTIDKTFRFVLYTLSTIHLVMIAVIVINARSLVKRNIENLKMFDDSLDKVKSS